MKSTPSLTSRRHQTGAKSPTKGPQLDPSSTPHRPSLGSKSAASSTKVGRTWPPRCAEFGPTLVGVCPNLGRDSADIGPSSVEAEPIQVEIRPQLGRSRPNVAEARQAPPIPVDVGREDQIAGDPIPDLARNSPVGLDAATFGRCLANFGRY